MLCCSVHFATMRGKGNYKKDSKDLCLLFRLIETFFCPCDGCISTDFHYFNTLFGETGR